jgi:hypothetical protein
MSWWRCHPIGLWSRISSSSSATPAAPTGRGCIALGVEVSPDDFYVARERLAIADRVWTLKVMPTSDYLMRGQHWPAFFVGAIGLALAALLQTLLLVTTGSTAAVQRKVNEQTAELNSKTIAPGPQHPTDALPG